MADFHQDGIVTTIHDLYEILDHNSYLTSLEARLQEFARHIRIGLLLPCLYSEILNPQVLDRIVDEIMKVRYLHTVVVGLGGATKEAQFQEAKKYFARLRIPERDMKVVWIEGPRVQEVLNRIQTREINTGTPGKGQSVWLALGYLFARKDCDVIALHDCDILTYDRIFLGRLILPTANIHNIFQFCKGYYPRMAPKEKTMYGRVSRLFMIPFCDTMGTLMQSRGYHEMARFFNYHRAFKYHLSGEVSFTARLGRSLDIAYDWGLEVAMSSEVYHRANPRRIAQISLTPNFDHKHQDLSPGDSSKGLHRMTVDIGKFYFNYMRSHGLPLDDAFVDMIRYTYYENTRRFIKIYSDDAEINNLAYDRHQEELTARYFRDFLETAWTECKKNPDGTLIPSWNRVLFSVPDIYDHLFKAVEEDNA